MTTESFNYEAVLSFWYGPLDEFGCADEAHARRWWKKDDSFDEAIRTQFGSVHSAAMNGDLDGWLATARGRLAYIVVLDQFSRNMFRGTKRMFESDAKAVEAALAGIELGIDDSLAFDERIFLYMPLMHSEDVGTQERCVELFTGFRDQVEEERWQRIDRNLQAATRHHYIVAEWGRFPHRNEILGRSSTALEIEFLKQPNSSF